MFTRRAVSPIVATVLLIIIAVAAGVLVWVWLHGVAQKNLAVQPVLREELKVEEAFYNSTANAIELYVRNIGEVNSTITDAYVTDTTTGVVKHIQISPPVTISPGHVKPVYVPYTVASGHVYLIKLVTRTGVEITYTYKP